LAVLVLNDAHIRAREVASLEKQRFPANPGERVTEAISEIQTGRMTTLAKAAPRFAGDFRMICGNGLYREAGL
jgi:hypothetical protein